MSLNKIFNKLRFWKHKPGKVVASSGDKVFKKLTLDDEQTSSPSPSPGFTTDDLNPDHFNLKILGLKPGTYVLTVTSTALSLRLAESDYGTAVLYTVE